MPVWVHEQQGPRVQADDAFPNTGPPTIGPGSYFGFSVAIADDGQTLLVGAPNIDLVPMSSSTLTTIHPGAAYVYILVGGEWEFQQKLSPQNPASDISYYGHSVALSADGNTALIGAPYDGANNEAEIASAPPYTWGMAEVWVRDGATWELQETIRPATVGVFGWSVDLTTDGNTAAISDWITEEVRIYTRTGVSWALAETLTGTGAHGWSLDFATDDRLIVGAPTGGGLNEGGVYPLGVVYVYELTAGWGEFGIYGSSSQTRYLGISVAGCAMGFAAAAYDDASTGGAVAVEIWEWDGLDYQEAVQINPFLTQDDFLSYQLSMSDGTLIAGPILVIGTGWSSDLPGAGPFPNNEFDAWGRTELEWVHYGGLPTSPSDMTGGGGMAFGSEITSDGLVIAIGAPAEETNRGGAWTFATPASLTVAFSVRVPLHAPPS
jgi:hypothetical protein